MEVKVGYKHTEGVAIPEGWELTKIQDIAPLQRGFDLPTKNIREGPFPVVYSNGILNRHDSFQVKAPGVVTGRSGTIGKVTFVEEDYWPHNTSLWVTDFNGNDPKFIYYLYSLINFERFGTGSGVPTLNRNDVHAFKVSIPISAREQTAIATALSDADALIKHLEKLLAKKRNIKQGAMQQLLTGKKRLPGFSGAWEVKKLGEKFSISAGGDLIVNSFSLVEDISYCYPIYSNSLANRGLYGFSKLYRHDENCITVTARGTIGVANTRNRKFDAIGRVLVLKPICELNCFFVSEYLNHRVKFSIESTGVPQLTAPQISKYEIDFPKPTEQTAIAQVLSDMDAEIEALEDKLTKFKMVKQGMMQELLTGKKRLI